MSQERTLSMEKYKTCSKCKQISSLENFCRNKNLKDGLSAWCRECQKRSTKLWILNNPEKAKQASRNWRHRNPEKYKTSLAQSRSKRKDEIKEYNRLYLVNNREKVNELQRENARRNPERSKNNNAKRRARKKDCQTYFISKRELLKLYGSPCFVCGSIKRIQLDHVIPIARNGNHSIGNLIPLCQKCNASKHDSFFMEWKLRKQKTNDWPL